MLTESQALPVPRASLWIGRILTAIAALFLLMDGVGKVLKAPPVMEACARVGVPERLIPGLGVVLIASALIYAIPQTSAMGAILLTGYLGGATWAHMRMGDAPFPTAFPSLLSLLIWAGLFLREPRLRAILPLRR